MSLKHLLPALPRDQRGVAALEFALILPIMVIIFFGAVDLSNMLIADSRVRNVSSNLADLISQKSNGVASVNDLGITNLAAQHIMAPLDFSDSRLQVWFTVYRPVAPFPSGGSRVVWSRRIIAGVGGSDRGSAYGFTTKSCATNDLPPALLPPTDTSTSVDVLRVQAAYEWHPWFTLIFGNKVLTSETYNLPRYTVELNSSGLTPPC